MNYELKLEEFDTYEDVFGVEDAPKLADKDCKVHLVFLTDIEMDHDNLIKNTDIIKEEMVEYGIINTDTQFSFEMVKYNEYAVVINIISK